MRVVRRSSSAVNSFEFHVSRKARKKYHFDEQLFALNGNVVLADFNAARSFAKSMTKINGQFVPASQINAMGLIDEILHILVRQYEMQNPEVMRRALAAIGLDADTVLLKFTEEFPPMTVYRGEMDAQHYLDLETAGRPNRAATLEEMLILHITNQNPAIQQYKELFDEEPLKQSSPYEQTVQVLKDFFKRQPGFGTSGSKGENRETLVEALMSPARVAPHSLTASRRRSSRAWDAPPSP